MKFCGSLLVFLFCSLGLMAQSSLSITGKLLDEEEKQPIVAGSVELLNPKDSTVLKGAFSNANGVFSINSLKAGKYIAKVTYLGYHTITQDITLTDSKTKTDLGSLYMKPSDFLLEEAVVDGKRPEVIVRNDTLEYDAASYKVPENSVIEDLLKKLPGVEVDADGKITANGKEIKKFMVDGKEFFSDDPQVASKNLPVDMVEKLQVVDRKSEMARLTGFDDGDEETIINITVKPGMKKGTMGNALVGMGRDMAISDDMRYQAGAFVNHMQNNDRYTLILNQNNNNNQGASDLGANQFGGMRMNRGGRGGITESTNLMFNMNKELSETAMLNGDIRYNRRDQFSESKTETTEFTEQSADFSESRSTNKYLANDISVNLRLDWKPDTLNTLIVEPYLRYTNSKGNRETPYNNQFDYNTGDTLYLSKSESHTKGEGIEVGGNLTYSHSFKAKKGRNLSIRLGGNYNDNYSWENSYSYALTYREASKNGEQRNQRSENDGTTNRFNANVSWVEPLGNNNFLQANYRVSYQDTKSLDTTYDMTDEEGTEFESPWWEENILLLASVNPDQSRSTERNAFEQRIGANMRMVRERYNISFGFNVVPSKSTTETYQPNSDNFDPLFMEYPYDSRLANLRGDSLISSIKQNVTNFSPTLNFNYNWDRQTRLRINYDGSTNQPSASQLRDYIDKNNIKSWSMGNPNLKPGYTNRLTARFNKYVQETQLSYNFFLNGQYSVNDITSVSYRSTDKVRLTTYENISGNWNANLHGMFNIPLKNKKFSVSSFVRFGYDHRKSYISGEDVEDLETANLEEIRVKNTGNNLTLSDRSSINYRSDLFDVGLNLSISYNDISYSAQPENNLETYNYGVGGYTTWYLPYKWTLESDINFTKRDGYASEEYNISETIWNAAVTKVLFSKKYGTGSLKLQVYDILQNRSNVSTSTTTNGFRVTENNTLPAYFMCSFIFKFNIFPGNSSASSEDMNSFGPGRGGRRGGPGGGRPF